MSTEIETLWNSAIQTIRPEVGDRFDLWFQPLHPVSYEGKILTLEVPNKFFSDWLKQYWQKRLEDVLKQLSGQDILLSYAVKQNIEEIIKASEEQSEPVPVAQQENEFQPSDDFNSKYTFESFVVGSANRFAHAAAEAVAKEPGRAFNPLFIYGGVGLGKTHLMHAIGHHTTKANPKTKVLYVTSEYFINEFIDSLRTDRAENFRNKYRYLDCLLIDDIQYLMGKSRSEEEFFYTFNSLFDSRKQIVVSSDRAPKETSLEARLISRLEWGVVVDIQPPDLETRIAILRKKAEREMLYVPEDVILYLASQIKSNVRELEGALIRVAAFASLMSVPLTVDIVKDKIKDTVAQNNDDRIISIDQIQKVVSKFYHLDVKDLRSQRRTDNVAMARQVAMYLTRELTPMSLQEIGQSFGGRDHSTVLYAQEKIKNKLGSDPFFATHINKIIEEIKSQED